MTTKQTTATDHLLQSQQRIDGIYHEKFIKDQVEQARAAREKHEAEKKAAKENDKK